MKLRSHLAISALLACAAGCQSQRPPENAPSGTPAARPPALSIILATKPRPKALDKTPLLLRVMDDAGAPVIAADVGADLSMPSMAMPPNPVRFREMSPGIYLGSAVFTMPGRWNVAVRVRSLSGSGVESFPLDVH